MVSAADVVGVHVLFPATFVDTVIADVAHQAAFRHVHSFYAFAVVYEVCCAAFVNTEIPGGFDSVDICTEEDEFPAVLFFLALDHFLDPFGGVLVAGVFVAVGSDDEDCLFGAVFIAGVLVYVSDMVNGPADGVEEGGTAAGIVFFVGQGLDAYASPDSCFCFSMVLLKPPMVSFSSPLMDPLRSRMNTISVSPCFMIASVPLFVRLR